MGRQYLQSTCLIKDLHLEYVENSYNSNNMTNDPIEKWATHFKRPILKEEIGIASKSLKNAYHH